jgi:hypothetical protein
MLLSAACENLAHHAANKKANEQKRITREIQYLKRQQVWQCPCNRGASGGADVVTCSVCKSLHVTLQIEHKISKTIT